MNFFFCGHAASNLAMWTVSVGGKLEKANWGNSDRGCHWISLLTQTLVRGQQRVKRYIYKMKDENADVKD